MVYNTSYVKGFFFFIFDYALTYGNRLVCALKSGLCPTKNNLNYNKVIYTLIYILQ